MSGARRDWGRIRELFHEALELPEDQRAGFLAGIGDDQEDLAREISEMLAAHGDESGMQVESHLLNDKSTDQLIGRQIGSYRLVRLLGRGGMGDVYLAERSDDQYLHQVALKLIRSGHGSGSLANRFLQERQILAQLDHPNIAMLLDGGMTEGGRPYLVMQFVDGEPITDFAQKRDISLGARLDLFRTVCQAVHVAHTNLVVHRDLKPANILVTAGGDVKLLDFGIAKLLDDSDPGMTTSLDRMLTPEHAAPEQVSGQPVTTATDVYALGVLLYELLTRERPFEIKSSSPTEIERLICETPISPPSSRGGKESRNIRGELDNIVMMALRKEPQRRYQSARELEEDIAHFQEGRPVRAQRDTFTYRLRKFVGRNRWPVTVGMVFLLMAAGFITMSIDQARKVAEERDRAQLEKVKAESVVEVLTDLLEGSDPTRSPDGEILEREDFIQLIGERVDSLSGQPDVQARLWELLGGIHIARSRYSEAREELGKALAFHNRAGGDPVAALRVGHTLAVMKSKTEGGPKAESQLRDSLQRHRDLMGNNHRDTGIAAQDLAVALALTNQAEAMELLDEAMAIAEFSSGVDSMAVASAFNQLGILTMSDGDLERAALNFERALALMTVGLGNDHPHVLTVSHNLASARSGLGEWAEAEAMHRQLIRTKQRVLGPQTQSVARNWDSLANSLAQQGRYDEAIEAYSNAEEIFRAILGDESREVSNTRRNIGVVLMAKGQAPEAQECLQRAISIDELSLDPENRLTNRKQGNLAMARFVQGERESGLDAAREALILADRLANGESDGYRADLRVIMVTMLLSDNRAVEAESLAREALDIRRLRNRDPNVMLARERCLLATALVSQGRVAEGGELLGENQERALGWGLLYPIQRDLITAAAAKVH